MRDIQRQPDANVECRRDCFIAPRSNAGVCERIILSNIRLPFLCAAHRTEGTGAVWGSERHVRREENILRTAGWLS